MNPGRYAERFRKTQAFDGYDPSLPLFKCKFTPFDDSPSDGSTGERRVLDVHPSQALPPRRVITLHEEQWIVGDDNVDDFFGKPTTKHYGMKKATNRLAMGLPGAICIEAARPLATDVADYATRFPVVTLPWAFVHRLYFKNSVDPLTTASYDNFWSFFVAPGEPAKKRWLLQDLDAGTLHFVRSTYSPPQNLLILQADELDEDAVRLVTFRGDAAYDPVSDTTTRSAIVVPAVRIEFSKDYTYRTEADQLAKNGDELLLIPKVAVPAVKPLDEFVMDGRTWRVTAFMGQLDCWKIHARRA